MKWLSIRSWVMLNWKSNLNSHFSENRSRFLTKIYELENFIVLYSSNIHFDYWEQNFILIFKELIYAWFHTDKPCCFVLHKFSWSLCSLSLCLFFYIEACMYTYIVRDMRGITGTNQQFQCHFLLLFWVQVSSDAKTTQTQTLLIDNTVHKLGQLRMQYCINCFILLWFEKLTKAEYPYIHLLISHSFGINVCLFNK